MSSQPKDLRAWTIRAGDTPIVAPSMLPAKETRTLDMKRGTLELVERQVSHIQKETMALLPLLDDLLDEETDRELAFAYASA